MFVASFATQLFNRFSNKDCFILLVISPVIDNLFPVFILCPEILRTAVAIVFDDIIGCLQDGFSRTVILLQQNDLGIRIILLKVQDILHICSPPAINRLVRIPNDTDIFKT